MAYEQKPNTFTLFRDSDETVAKRREFYKEKGWEGDPPIYSGRLVLEDGTELNIEARVIDGQKGKFFAGRVWKKKDAAPAQSNSRSNNIDLDDEIPF
jgi:hypothetical protein